jgi:hypothetical protein
MRHYEVEKTSYFREAAHMTTTFQVQHTLATLRFISLTLPDMLALPDPEAAEALTQRMALLDMVDQAHEVSYSQRLVIIREFETRQLWKYLIDPLAGVEFSCLTAWLSSGFIGCRRTNMEAHRDAKALSDAPAAKLLDVPKANIRLLTQLSTAVRNEPDVLEAARTLKPEQFEEKIEAEHPGQHLEARKPLRFRFGRSQARKVEEWIQFALEHDLAGTREQAVEWACVEALENAQIDARLDEESIMEEARV